MKITLEVVYGSKRTIREAVRAAGAGPQDVESVLEPFGAHCRAGSYGIRLEKYESNLKYQVETLEFDENHDFRGHRSSAKHF
jgi:hypothetical protein